MDGPVRLAAARALWWHRYCEHTFRALGGYPVASPTLHFAQSHLGCSMDWPGGLSLDVPNGTICPTLVLARSLVLDHFVPVELAPTFSGPVPGTPSRGAAGGNTSGLWRDAFHHGLPLCARL